MKTTHRTDNPFLAQRSRRPRRAAVRRYASNTEAVEALNVKLASTKSTSTVRNSRQRLSRFLEYLGDVSIYDVTPEDLEDYFDNVAIQCKHLKRGGLQTRQGWSMQTHCMKKQPLNCSTQCPLWEAIAKQTVGQHVIAVNRLYKFLATRKHIPVNICQGVSDAWWEDNQRVIRKEKAASSEGKRFLTRPEAVQWVNASTEIKWATYELITLRYGFRASEMARLSTDPEYLDPELEWFAVPQARGNDGKRIAVDRYPIDEEVRRYFVVYLRWRTKKLKALDTTSTRLFFDDQGLDYPTTEESAAPRFNKSLRRMARKAGLEDPHGVTSHIGRRFLTDTAQQHGVHGNDLKLIRGDFLESEATGNYTDKSRLASIWRKASPPLGVNPPRGYYTGQGAA